MFKKSLLATVAIYTVFGFIITPQILKPQLIQSVDKELNANIAIESISFNPYIFKLKISGIELTSLQKKHLISLDYISIDIEPHSLFNLTLHLKELIIQNPKVSVVVNADKSINLLSILKESREEAEEESAPISMPRVKLDLMSIVDGSLYYEDNSKKSKFDFTFDKIGFKLKDIDTDDLNQSDAQLRLYSQLSGGGFIDLKSDIEGLNPLVVDGSFNFQASKLYTSWRYMKEFLNFEVADGEISFETKYHFNLEDLNATTIYDASLQMHNLRVKPKATHEDVLKLDYFHIDVVDAKPMKQEVLITDITLNSLYIKAKRDSVGDIDWLEYIKVNRPKVEEVSDKNVTVNSDKKSSGAQWKFLIKHFALNSAEVLFEDTMLSNPTTTKIDKINFNAYDIDSKKESWLEYDFSSRVNAKGYITSKGDICHTPLKQKGDFKLSKISLVELNPYIQESAFVKLTDGYLTLNSKTQYAKSKNSPDLKMDGSMKIEEFFVNDSRDDTTLLSFNEFGFKAFSVETSPNRVHIDEAYLNSFYVDAFINEKKELNFSLLTKSKSQKESKEEETSKKSSQERSDFPIKVTKLSIDRGSAKFADFSIPLKFKTHIHDLNGEVYSISNAQSETSYIDIKGEVDKYGATKLKGSINSANPEKYTDIDFSFSNLELNSLTGYSASFAGHEIESGKLYLDLGYEIFDSELKGSNSIVVKQMRLGNEFKEENVTSLPLGFIIGLLEDSDGIIDIDMPVEGDVDEPDFKYGSFVFKTFGNLLLKAVTSPFSFLGSMMGLDGESLEFAEFEVGHSNILPPEREKLDKIAEMMMKRPKISILISGKYDEVLDTKELKFEKLITLVVNKSGIKNRTEHKSVMTIELLEDIYEELTDDDKLNKIKETLTKKYAQDEETFNREYLKRVIEETLTLQVVSKEELEALATSRVNAMKEYLVNSKNVVSSRVDIGDIKSSDKSEHKRVKMALEIVVK